MSASLEIVPMRESDYLAFAQNRFGNQAGKLPANGAPTGGPSGVRETTTDGLRLEGKSFAEATWVPSGFAPGRVVRVGSESVFIEYLKKGGARDVNGAPRDPVLRVETHAAVSFQVETGAFTPVTLGDGLGYFVHGAWAMQRVQGQVQWVKWDRRLTTSLVFPLQDRVIIVHGHPAESFNDDELLKVARSVAVKA